MRRVMSDSSDSDIAAEKHVATKRLLVLSDSSDEDTGKTVQKPTRNTKQNCVVQDSFSDPDEDKIQENAPKNTKRRHFNNMCRHLFPKLDFSNVRMPKGALFWAVKKGFDLVEPVIGLVLHQGKYKMALIHKLVDKNVLVKRSHKTRRYVSYQLLRNDYTVKGYFRSVNCEDLFDGQHVYVYIKKNQSNE